MALRVLHDEILASDGGCQIAALLGAKVTRDVWERAARGDGGRE